MKLLDTSNTSRRYFDELPASPTASSNTAPPLYDLQGGRSDIEKDIA